MEGACARGIHRLQKLLGATRLEATRLAALGGEWRSENGFERACETEIGCYHRTIARKTPAISTRKCSCQKLANRCPTLGQLLGSRILYVLLVGKTVRNLLRNRQGKILYTELLKSWPTLGQLLDNSPPHGNLQGSSLQ